MADHSPEDSLIKAARSLDQKSAESIPDTLSGLWALLSKSISGPFHASEELILRWLLKNMNGSTETAEQFRRYPMAWRIMARAFTRIPLISLAKSLADRRFIPILQQTLKDISKPQGQASKIQDESSDVDMVDAEDASSEKMSKKRKRSPEVQFDLEKLRTSHGCLRAAEALFDSLQVLLARLEPVEAGAPSNVRMGAEHIKSLFCSPAKDAAELLRPILTTCDLFLTESESEPLDNQASWIGIFSSLWNFHLQSSSDAVEVAMSLYTPGCIILAKLDRSKDITVDPHVKSIWTRDLRRFFIKNMVLSARATFLNRKDIGIIKAAAESTSFVSTASYPVLFSLSVKAPYSTEDASAKKDHEDWTQNVFKVIEEPMRDADPVKRNQAMKIVLDTALQSKASISLESLRTVCRQHTAQSGRIDLGLVTQVANLDVDAFLISNDGHALLDEILEQINGVDDEEFNKLSGVEPAEFIAVLAKGFARARDLSGFFKKWFAALAGCLYKGENYSSIVDIWTSHGVVKTVANLLQSSINTRQLLALLDWLDSQAAVSKPEALLVIIDAISQGITEEEFVDDVDYRLYEIISTLNLRELGGSTKARWWRIVDNTVSRSTLDKANSIWSKVESDLKKAIKKGELSGSETLAAFRCCGRFWLANYGGGARESDAASTTCAFLKRLEKDTRRTSTTHDSKYFESPRLIDLILKHEPGTHHIQNFLRRIESASAMGSCTPSVLYDEVNLSSHEYIDGIVDHAIAILAGEKDKKSPWATDRIFQAIRLLLNVPSEALAREQREKIMPNILHFVVNLQSQGRVDDGLMLVSSLLSLMVKIMKRPTFYEGMKFADLVTIGESLVASIQANIDAASASELLSSYSIMKLFDALTSATLRQMTSNLEKRERAYIAEASSTVLSWSPHWKETEVHRHIILRSVIVAFDSSKAQDLGDIAAVSERLSLIYTDGLCERHMWKQVKSAHGLEADVASYFALISVEQFGVIETTIARDRLIASKTHWKGFWEEVGGDALKQSWVMKGLLFKTFRDLVTDPLDISTETALGESVASSLTPLELRADAADINHYVDLVLGAMDAQARNHYFANIGRKLRDDRDISGCLLAIHRLLRAETDPKLRSSMDKMDLAEVHNVLVDRLVKSRTSSEFVLIAQTIYVLLDKKASSMKQWNTEVTLSIIATISAGGPQLASEIKTYAKTYDWLCRLLEVIIKRHRLRLEGHFHLLITALQALLRLLLVTDSTSPSPTSSSRDPHIREQQAKLFSRLLTLVCEPSVASVTRGQPAGQLDSATDAAKRSAGQHMYLVLMLYIRLQLEHAVPRVVREALQPGVYSILDITTQEGRRILNEAVDNSGRAIFREMYRRYIKFGKWSGV